VLKAEAASYVTASLSAASSSVHRDRQLGVGKLGEDLGVALPDDPTADHGEPKRVGAGSQLGGVGHANSTPPSEGAP